MNMNEEEKIKNLFKIEIPGPSSSRDFISRVEEGMKAIDLVIQERKLLEKKNRWRALLSGAAGFISGVIVTFFYRSIMSMCNLLMLKIIETADFREVISIVLTSVLIAAASLCVTLFTYKALTTDSNLNPFLISNKS